MEPENDQQVDDESSVHGNTRLDVIRLWLNKHTVTVTICANIALLCALTTIVLHVRPRAVPPGPMAYYFNLSDDTLFAARTNEFPPIHTPETRGYGKRNGVRAFVFSCGDCSKTDKQRYIGFLQAFTEDAKSQLQNAGGFKAGSPNSPGPMVPDVMYMMSTDGHLVATPDKRDKWVNANSEEGRAITNDAMKKCGPTVYPRACSADEDPTWQP